LLLFGEPNLYKSLFVNGDIMNHCPVCDFKYDGDMPTHGRVKEWENGFVGLGRCEATLPPKLNKGNMKNMFTLSEALEALQGHDEFVEKHYDGLVVLDYIVVFPDSFKETVEEIRQRAYYLWEKAGGPVSDPDHFWLQAEKEVKRFAWLRRNFRGVTFSEATGELLSLPLHKFFNINQTEDSQFDLHKHKKATIYEKMDGSMIHFFMHPDGRLLASTCRSSQTPQAQEALALANRDESVKELILQVIADGWTPIFEFVAAHNQIVVQYPKPRLVYLISRNRMTGDYHFDERFPDKTNSFEFSFVDVFSKLDKTEFEGYVCHLEDSHGSPLLLKAKTPWYMERHRAVDALMRPAYTLYEVVYKGIMDDLIAMAADSYKPILTRIYEEAQHDLLQMKLQVETQFEDLLEKAKNLPEVQPVNKILEFEEQVEKVKASGRKMEAIKMVRDFSGLGLQAAKQFVETGEWPHGFIRQDEASEEARKLIREKATFAELAKKEYPDNFSLIMSLYSGAEPDDGIKLRLMEVYREKYPNKLYASVVDT